MSDENTKPDFPRKLVYGYLQDIEHREQIITDNLNMITLSRTYIEKLLQCYLNEGQ